MGLVKLVAANYYSDPIVCNIANPTLLTTKNDQQSDLDTVIEKLIITEV